MNWENLKRIISEAKYVIATIAVVFSSFVGGYQIVSEHFVTRAYADELVKDAQTQIKELKNLNIQNTIMILELRLISYDKKLEKGLILTPTEKREYKYLQEKVDKLKL